MEVNINSETEVSVEFSLNWVSLPLIKIKNLELLLWAALVQAEDSDVSHVGIMGDI